MKMKLKKQIRSKLGGRILFVSFISATISTFIFYQMHSRTTPIRQHVDTKQVVVLDLKDPPSKTQRHVETKQVEALDLKEPSFKAIKENWHRRVKPVPKYPFNDTFTFLLEPNFVCSDEEPLLVLALIHSSPYHVNRRRIIRKTWGNTSYLPNHERLRIIFLFGSTNNERLDKVIQTEHKSHGDILQGRFSDSYFNLSFNTMMGLSWVKDKCKSCKVVVKSDDDVVIDMLTFIQKVVLKLAEKSKQIFCSYGETKIFRTKDSKHYVSNDYFEGRDTFPSHCEGKLVMMTNDMVPALYRSALTTPFFFIEDVFFYGQVLNKIQGINITQMIWNKDFQLRSFRAKPCLERKKKQCSYFIAGADSEEDIEQLWLLFRQRNH